VPPPPPHHAAVVQHPPQSNGTGQALPSASGATINPATSQSHRPVSIDQAVLSNQATAAAGPSTAGSGLFDNLASSQGPSTASLQGNHGDGDAQIP
jgi:transcription initiation factor TFIID subunit TAF12